MKTRAILIPLSLFLLTGLVWLFSQQNPEEAKFMKTLETYLDDMWKFYPTTATLLGYYKYNDKLEDMSEANIDRRHDSLDNYRQLFLAKIDRSKLSSEMDIDLDIALDSLDYEVLKHENLLPWEYNPLFYNELFYFSIQGLLSKEFADINTRLKSAIERAKLLPKLIQQAKANLKTPPQLFTETAIKQFPTILDFYRNEIPRLIETASPDLKSRFQAEIVKVIPALEDYQRFLQNELLPRSTGNFRLGEVHPKLLRITLQNTIPIDELIARSRADYSNLRREMAIVSMPFYRIMYPHINMEQLSTQYTEEQLRNLFIRGVLDKIKIYHPTPENFLESIKNGVSTLREFIAKNNLAYLPAEPITIVPMPIIRQMANIVRVTGPGPYEKTGAFRAEIAPFPSEWKPEQINSFLEDYNHHFLYFWITSSIFPGPFVPLAANQQNPSLLRKLYPNQPLIKGWPVYFNELLVTSGFGDYDLKLRMNELKHLLQIVIDFQLELNIHQGGMTKEQAIDLMTKGGFQSPIEAERKWNQIILNPGEAIYAYVGYQEILDLEKEYRKIKGDAFSPREFLNELMKHGALPLRHLRNKILRGS
ncbi:MAG: DUF885 domain-containing protein [Candidatus Aminicenantes bacterium]|nr:DUF885 domain-containing protein [Candidatus Aminicenantes bacterium]